MLADLRAAVARVVGAVGVPIRHPRHLRDALELHQTLAWKVLRIVQTTDLLADAQYIPGPSGFATFLQAAAGRGVDERTIQDADDAFGRFRSMIDAQAGDRQSLELMLNGLTEAGDSSASDSRAARKAGFRCASSTWGIQVRTRLLSQIIGPADEAGLFDIALIRGSIGMRRIRPGAVLPIGPMVVLDDGQSHREKSAIRPLDPGGVTAGMALLPKFCSKPLPPINLGKNPRGAPEHQLGEAPVGGKEGMTVYFGEVRRSVGLRRRDEISNHTNTALTMRLPIETAIIDVWAHRDLCAGGARGLLYGELSGVPWYEQEPGHEERLVLAEEVETLGAGLNNAPLLDVPEYTELMQLGFDRLGWNHENFVLHRLRVEYPVIATALVLQLDLRKES